MRPIDADALVSDIEDARKMVFHSPYERRFHEDRIEFALGMVEDMPTLDYAPVKHGKWIPWYKEDMNPKTGFSRGLRQFGWSCSACHWRSGICTRFCPNCGARMDGVKENG